MAYKDDPNDIDDDNEADGGGLNVPPARHARSYDSILDEEDPVMRLRRRRRADSGHATRNGLACCWLCFVFLLIIAAAGLVFWRFELKQHPEGINLFGNGSKIYEFLHDDGADDDDDHVYDPPKINSKGSSTKGKAAATIATAIPSGAAQASIQYDPKAALHYYNPFDFAEGDWYGSVAVPPPVSGESGDNNRLGFFMQPNLVGQHLVFVTEGDMYYTQLNFATATAATAAMKLTTTVGNVRTPVLNPKFPYYVAFTATYTGHREVYLMDLRPSHRSQPAMRLTYSETSYGVRAVVGWKDDGLTLVFAAASKEVGLPDTRLYSMALQQAAAGRRSLQETMQVLKISPVPLSQAIDGTWKDGCVFFTRFQQSSNTARYVGGTAESLWAYCDGRDEAVPLTSNYRGTSKSPRVAMVEGREYLLFLSDRDTTTGTKPATMNLFGITLPTESMLYGPVIPTLKSAVALTHASCDFNGLALQEYSVDGGNVVLRVGADFHLLPNDNVVSIFSNAASVHDTKELDIVVYSDFHEHQERLLSVSMPSDMTSFDVFETAFGSTAALLGVRGQLFVAPVVPETHSITDAYAGAGMNIPPRRYRVAPGMTTGGSIRVLSANFVPLPQEEGKTTRRLAVILATDPKSPTAEHAFYLIETQSDSVPSFVDIDDLPDPFLGGSKSGGSVEDGGLGSVNADSVRVSPCGRRMVWSDTDGRICVMTMPMYQAENHISQYETIPKLNDNAEPIMGVEAEIAWSPGGRYLAIGHQAKNQFEIISIVDCGDPNIEGTDQVADMTIGSVVQATPSRFNSGNPTWGKTGMDFATEAQQATLAQLLGEKPPTGDGATVLYFLSDRDIVDDAGSPWGSRAPSPHFPVKQSVYALPLVGTEAEPMNPMAKGIYGGGGAAELWSDGMIELQLKMEALAAAAPPSNSVPKERHLNQKHLLAAAAVRQQRADDRERRRLIDWAQATQPPGVDNSTDGATTVAPVASVGTAAPVAGGAVAGTAAPVAVAGTAAPVATVGTGAPVAAAAAADTAAPVATVGTGAPVTTAGGANTVAPVATAGTGAPVTTAGGANTVAPVVTAGTGAPVTTAADTAAPVANVGTVASVDNNATVAAPIANSTVDAVDSVAGASTSAAVDNNATVAAPITNSTADAVESVAGVDTAAAVDNNTTVDAPTANSTVDTVDPAAGADTAAPVDNNATVDTVDPVASATTPLTDNSTLNATDTIANATGVAGAAADATPEIPANFTVEPEPELVTSSPSSMPSSYPSTVEPLSTTLPSSMPSSYPSSGPSAPPVDATTESPSGEPSSAPSLGEPSPVFPNDREIDFGEGGLTFARKAYRIGGIPAGKYSSILCQLSDDPSLLVVESTEKGSAMKLFAFEDFPSDKIDETPIYADLDYMGSGISTTRNHLLFIFSGLMKVVPNTVASVLKMMGDTKMETHIVDTIDMSISVWPSLEYEQMFNDAWRMLRDYFYDTNMNGVDWVQMHTRYKDLVKRCSKREELDNVLAQMAAELSALHVFVYGGEYGDPTHGNEKVKKMHEVASLGASFERSVEYKGYIITSVANRDPDFNLMDGKAIYSPLSKHVLGLSGQRGLEEGDVIVGINGESVMRVPDMHMLLRGMAGRSVRLDVIRQPMRRQLVENTTSIGEGDLKPKPVIAVPISQEHGDNLRYAAWEWQTREKAQALAKAKSFTVGYLHLRSMSGPDDMDAFARGFFSDYDKNALIIDVRHNRGGNIDSWLLDILQRKAWSFWQGRATNINNGGLGWDQQFAFRGHIVVLIDEKTSSDGEGFSRGVSELGLGKLVGTRTWGGGIWLSSDNHLVDGGIATAPEIGTYNDNFGWGLGIEQQGVEPDVEVDNNPRVAFDGRDQQLEKAVEILAQWLVDEPIVQPKQPGAKKDMSLQVDVENCAAKL